MLCVQQRIQFVFVFLSSPFSSGGVADERGAVTFSGRTQGKLEKNCMASATEPHLLQCGCSGEGARVYCGRALRRGHHPHFHFPWKTLFRLLGEPHFDASACAAAETNTNTHAKQKTALEVVNTVFIAVKTSNRPIGRIHMRVRSGKMKRDTNEAKKRNNVREWERVSEWARSEEKRRKRVENKCGNTAIRHNVKMEKRNGRQDNFENYRDWVVRAPQRNTINQRHTWLRLGRTYWMYYTYMEYSIGLFCFAFIKYFGTRYCSAHLIEIN